MYSGFGQGKDDGKLNWKRKALSLLLSAALVSSLAAPALAMTPPTDSAVPDTLADGFSDDPTRYEIYPVPHHIEYPSDAAKIVPTSTVNVIAEEGIDSYTLAFLREILSSYGLTMNQTDKIASGQTNILLGIHGSEGTADAAAPEPKTYDDLFTSYDKVVDGKYDPYLMAVTADEPRGTITIVGADSDGVYCGLATLQMMFSSFSGRYLLPVTIEDYSNSRFRGFVEGFYGGFDYVGRESQMRSIRDVKGNMYVFASKNDRYHAEDWDKLYPEDELKQIAHLVQVGEETKVDYAWSVHIGKGGFFNGASSDPDSGTKYEKYLENVEKLEVKFQQLYDVGVRNFHILNDDYNSGTNADVVALLNTMNGWLKEKGCGPLVYCCKGYNTAWAGNGAELNALQELDEDIYLYWTGADVNSPINQDNVNWPHSKSGHYTVTWLNYPCSEHAKSGMFLGDISHYVSNADGLTNNLGILSNPVNYPEANKVAYFQLLSWAWNRDSYSTYITQLWEDCFKYLQPEVYDSYLAIARNVSNCPDSGRIPNGFPESEYLKDKLAAVQEKVLSGSGDLKNDPDVQALLDEFAHILSAVEDFRDNCANAALVKELEPWLKSLSGVAQAGKGGLEAAIALADGNLEGAWAGFSSASLGLDQWDNYDTPNYAGTKAKAGSKRLQPFASKVVEYVGAELNTALNPGGLGGGAPTFYGRLGGKNLSATANSDRMFDGKDGTYAAFDSGYVQQQGDYFGVDLGKVQTVTNIRILQGADDSDQNYFHKAVLQCSANGKDWVELTGRVNAQEIHYERPISARYVRLYLEEIGYPNPDDSGYKPDYWTRVREFTVETAGEGGLYTSVEVPESTKVTEDGGVYTLSGLSNVTLAPGGYVGLDLGEVVGVKSISAKDLDGSLTLQYSANGLVWTVCGAEPSPFSARYCRVVNLGEEAVTETLPDLEVTLSDPKLTPSMVKTNVNTVNAGAWANVFDGDVSTYVQTKTNQAEGQYFIFDLGASVPVYDLKFYTHESNDYIYYMDIAIGNSSSPDGEWTTIGTVDNNTQMDPPYRTFSCDGGGQRMVLPLEWSCEDYDAEQPGKYTFTGAYDLTGLNLTNPGGFTVTGQVTVRQDPDAVPEEPEPAPSGTPIDLTTSCQVTASGTEQNNDQWAPEKLVDGDSSTRWSAVPNMKQKNDRNPENQTKGVEWVYFDLATGNEMSGDYQENEPIYLTEITVKGTAQNKAWPTDYEIQVSDTAEENSWKTVATFHCDSADHKGTEDQVTELDPNTAQGRYLRILVNGMNIYADAATAVSIDDVVVMGYQADADPAHQAMPLAASQAVDLIHDTDDGAAREVYVSGREVANATGPEFAVDGKEDTYWSGNGMKKQGDATDQLPSWIVVDLGENVESIFNVTMQFNKKVWPTELVIQAATSTYNPTDYADINVFREKRDDGLGDAIKGDNAESANIWHNLATKSCDSLSDTPTVVVDNLSAIPEGTRYLRVFFKSMNGVAAGHAIGLKELNVYGTRFAPVVKVDPEIKSVVPVVATAIAGEVAQARLPGRVVAVLADDSRVALEVTWSLDEADDSPTEEIPVIVTGTITLPDDESVKNTGNVSASMNLTLTDEPKVDGSVPVKVNPSTLTVAAGTDVESLNLPASVSVQMDNGLVVVCPVTWDTSTYDPKLMGPQTITGTYTYDPSHSLLRAAGSGAITGKVEITVIPVRSAPEDVTVSFDSNGGTPVETQTVEYNTPVSKPEDPTRDGFTFDGWYLDYGLERPWDFDRKVTSSLTLYAKWTEDTSDDSHSASSSSGSSSYRARASVRGDGSVELSSNRPRVGQTVTVSIVPGEGMYLAQIQAVTTDGKAVALTKVSENRYTFVQPRGAVTVSATFLPLSGGEETHFFDVEPSAWYAEAVRFVVEQGIMQGIGGGLFDPSGVMNRSMLVTMLHRLAGEPGGGTASFTDVSAGIWYSDAVAWAASAELTGGYGDGRFGPTDAVTREQVAALLFRYAQLQKLELAADQSVPDFSDTASVSGWAKEAMDWAVRTGLLSGKNGGILDPLGTATRAEVATILMRFIQSTAETE